MEITSEKLQSLQDQLLESFRDQAEELIDGPMFLADGLGARIVYTDLYDAELDINSCIDRLKKFAEDEVKARIGGN